MFSSAGFNAADWTSKARIFNLQDEGQIVHVQSTDKTYTAPPFVSVVTDGPQSRRVEDSCVSVSTLFDHYLHTYQESVSFDIGIHTDSFGLGIAAHHDVKEVYEAITKNGQALGMSEAWWGLYEVTLPPPFLMTSMLDPMFKQAVAYLKSIGKPKSDGEQAIYNQVCCGPSGYGTHYVGSIIVGGKTSVETFVNSSFHKEYSEKTVSDEVSIGFEYEKLKLSLDDHASDVEKHLLEQFKNSSHRIVKFQPDLKDIYDDPAPWKKWEAAVAEHPSVVNTSVSSIANLFFESSEVMVHMQQTIDFYVKNNKVPSFRDFNDVADESLQSEHSKTVPGMQVVGCGFDAPSMTSKNCLFSHSSSLLPPTEWSNPYYPDIVYEIPYGFFAANTPESLLVNSTMVMNTIDDYVENSIYSEHHHHSGFLGFGSKDETTTTHKYYRNFYAHTFKLALTLRQIAWFSLRLSEFPLPEFSYAYQASLDYLPEVFDEKNATHVAIFKMFFEAFGTDVVLSADMGGVVWAENWFESCLTKIYTDECIKHEVSESWWFAHKHHTTESCDKRIVSDFQKYAQQHYEMMGGTSGEVKEKDWDMWVKSVKYDPRPVKMGLAPLHYLLSESHPKKKALEAATLSYLKENHENQQKLITELEKIRPPPASVCNRTAAETPVFDSLPKSIFDILLTMFSDPADILCPFVGYHGAYCPTQYTAVNTFPQGNTPLPRGVGLTIDVTTGELKLPALDYKYDHPTSAWTDPQTKITFDVPEGMYLSTGDITGENVAKIRVFKSEKELVSVWETGYKQGNWLGGEFGQSKSILDLYNKFFSKQQSTSINQHPRAIYKLSVGDGWEKRLNVYVRAALSALPEQYDSNVYSRFMDTWGTHVATNTLVGGMFEQQVAMKDCVWNSPYLTGGLTDEELQRYLHLDLSKDPTQDSFYISRRQMHIDHRIGGNPEVVDDAAWLKGLALNPALLKIYSQVDWPTVVGKASIALSATVVDNLRRAISERMAAREAEREKDKQETARRRIEELQGPRSVVALG